jgi:hypothetical protein
MCGYPLQTRVSQRPQQQDISQRPRQQDVSQRPRQQDVSQRPRVNGGAFAVCVDLKNPSIPRIIVCILYITQDDKKIERLVPRTLGDIIGAINNTHNILEKTYTVEKLQFNETYFKNQNMQLIRYGGGEEIMETKVLLEYKINGMPNEELIAVIIRESNKVLRKQRSEDDEALYNQPHIDEVKWESCTIDYTILIVSQMDITDYASLMFNYWLAGDREPEFKDDTRYPLVGVFNAYGCLQEMKADRRIPTQNVLFNSMTPVDQHLHFEGTGYRIGSDMARISIVGCDRQ